MNDAYTLSTGSNANRRLLDYMPELEMAPDGARAGPAPWRDGAGDMDFAARLLEARTPGALLPVLSELVDQAGGARRAALRAPVVGVLHRAARMVFPVDASRAPADLKRKAAGLFGLELEGLSPEDKEFEVARRFVRLAGEAARQALARPRQQPQHALAQSARRNAPGLLRQQAAARPADGRWRRRGRDIDVLDC